MSSYLISCEHYGDVSYFWQFPPLAILRHAKRWLSFAAGTSLGDFWASLAFQTRLDPKGSFFFSSYQ